MKSFKLITFCSHQPFLHLFHKTAIQLDIIPLKRATRFLQNWDPRVRPLPKDWELIDGPTAAARVRAGTYHAAMAHNINDYLDLIKLRLPTVLVMHTSISSRFVEEQTDVDKGQYRTQFAELVRRTGGHMVFVTQTKKDDWRLPGDVIVAGVDPDDYPTYDGTMPRLLRVTNHLKKRGGILGYNQHQRISDGYPIDVVGENPDLPGAQPAESWDQLKHFYQSRRAFLHTARPVMEDGFNLAVIEAMAAGMPIVSTNNPTSPIIDGINGYQSDDLSRLHNDVGRLMQDRELALRLGKAARETVRERFHYSRFAQQWHQLLTNLTA